MNVAAIIVTRGDQDITPVVTSLLGCAFDEILLWDNSGQVTVEVDNEPRLRWLNHGGSDLSVYGRYAAIEYTEAELIYVQDDDCIVSDPQAIVDAWLERGKYPFDGRGSPWGSDPRDYVDHVVCNMPQEFRHSFYEEHALVGFGAVFHRDAPQRAFDRFLATSDGDFAPGGWFRRTCDIVFTALTPRVLADVPHENLPWAYRYDRMYRQPELLAERVRMLDLVRELA